MTTLRKLRAVVRSVTGPKIFCLSTQKTATTSVGRFFTDHGYLTATHRVAHHCGWQTSWLKADYETIFRSPDFRLRQVFEDSPWWYPDAYKVLFHRFRDARFILLERDPDAWFDSMLNHFNRPDHQISSHLHAVAYRREAELFALDPHGVNRYSHKSDGLLLLNESHRDHYKEIYVRRGVEITDFFGRFGPDRLFRSRLEVPNLWQDMGEFFGIHVPTSYSIHANRTGRND